jgi:hypothetical protein
VRIVTHFWKGSPTSKYIPGPAFGKTGMSRNRFDEILQRVRSDRQAQPLFAGRPGLGKKGGIHDWPFRVNCSALGLIVVDAWLVYSDGRGFVLVWISATFMSSLIPTD